nr:hypothetical protein [Tanacetum cinerariifolium]
MTEKEMLAVVYAFEKFWSYLIMNKSIVYTDHFALKYLFAKKDSKARLLRWVLLLQKFKFKVIDTKGAENLAADHLSRLENPHQNVLGQKEINEMFPLKTLNVVSFRGNSSTPWFFDFANYRAGNFVVKGMSFGTPRSIISDRETHFCNDQFTKVMLKYGVTHRIATAYHPQTSGQMEVSNLGLKRILERTVGKNSASCGQVEVSNRGLKRILERTIGENHASWSDKLDDALWPFRTAFKTPIEYTLYKLVYGKACHLPIELEHKAYWAIKHCNYDLLTAAVDYLSKWVEAKVLPTNDARVVYKFLKSLFARFGTPRSIISDRETHFCNDQFTKVMLKYGVTHRIATAYHPQTSGQTAGDHRKVQINELNELRDQDYKNSPIYKEKTKRLCDSKIKDRIFNIGDRVLLFNSRLNIFSTKLKTHWSGPFTITHVFPYGTIELSQTDGPNFKVNGHRLKHYFEEDIPKMVVPDLQTFPKEQ